jgi:hypothetical protein
VKEGSVLLKQVPLDPMIPPSHHQADTISVPVPRPDSLRRSPEEGEMGRFPRRTPFPMSDSAGVRRRFLRPDSTRVPAQPAPPDTSSAGRPAGDPARLEPIGG